MRTTIKDVARRAGCAIGTVSDIVNRNKMDRYSGKTIERVKAVAHDLGYVPNKSAATLRSGKTGVIGVTHGLMLSLNRGFNIPYVNNIYSGIGKALSDKDFDLFIHNVNKVSVNEDTAMGNLVNSRQIDGLIYVYFSGYEEWYRKFHEPALKQVDIPSIIIHSTTRPFAFGNIGLNTENGAYLATRHLIEHGYPTIGFVGEINAKELYDNLLMGYRRALQDAGIAFNPAFSHSVKISHTESGIELVRSLVRTKQPLPRAFFVGEEIVAHGMVKAFNDAGINVPDDVALIGFGDYIDEALIPHSMTTLVQPGFEKGLVACEQLFSLLAGGSKETIIMESTLKIRGSCGCRQD